MRYFLEIAYRGTNYHGWQVQPNAHTVQAELEGAMSKILGRQVDTVASGRTDTGVHAEQQFVHFDIEEALKEDFMLRLNRILPADILVRNIFPVKDSAHARFDAVSRTYEYRITLHKDPFLIGLATAIYKKPDIDLMNKAAAILLQHQDFQSFSKVHTDVKTFLCDVSQASWELKSEHYLVFTIKADRFLRGMVRAIVGTMLEVGFGKVNFKDFEKIILAKDRSSAGQAAPPEGLFLTRIEYLPQIKQ